MTNKEVNNLIKDAKTPNWFKNIEAAFIFSHLNINFKKKGFDDIYQYVARQVRGWDKIDFKLPAELHDSKYAFSTLIVKLEVFLENRINDDEYSLENNWRDISREIGRLDDTKFFPIDYPTTLFLIEIAKKGNDFYKGAFNYFFNSNSLSINKSNEFAGALMAYEYEFEDSSKIPQRRSAEKSSNAQIRNAFEKTFTETQQSVGQFLKETKERSKIHAKEVIDLVAEKKAEYEKWFLLCKENDQIYTKQNLERAKELELLYREKLKLEAPADYWKKRASKLHSEGKNWLIALSIVTAIAIISLGAVLFFISDGTLKELFDKTGSAVRWSVVFITFVSFLAYGIRTFAKLMFSSFHLSRDAEEREQLAYVYLSLKDNQAIDDTERHLIMQSLFSRADSGLLKDDASPTMPGGSVIEKIIGGGKQ